MSVDLFGASAYRKNYVYQISQTVESYDIELRVVLELIQNSMDAIQKSAKTSGEIDLFINLPEKTIEIFDNGRGFPPKEELLYLGGTDKGDGDLKGKIGVGMKSAIFGSSFFELSSLYEGKQIHFLIRDAKQTLSEAIANDGSSDMRCEADWSVDDDLTGAETFTKIKIVFSGDELIEWLSDVYDKVFKVEGLDNGDSEACELLYKFKKPFPNKPEAMFRLYFHSCAYSADVERTLGISSSKPVNINVKIHVGNPKTTLCSNKELEVIFTEEDYSIIIKNEYIDFERLLKEIPDVKRPFSIYEAPLPPGGQIGTTLKTAIWILKLTEKKDILSLITDSKNRCDKDKYSKLLEKIRGIYLIMGPAKSLREFIPGGPKRLLAARGILTAHHITNPRSARHELYIPRIHMIIDLDAELNYGKKHLKNNKMVTQANSFFGESYKNTLFFAAGSMEERIKLPRNVDDVPYISREKLLGEKLPLKRVPKVEQDVIVLFSILLGNKNLKGFNVYGLSQVEQYDGKFLSLRAKDSHLIEPASDDQLYTIEFKVKLSSLLEDFYQEKKFSYEINLSVVWEVDITTTPDARFRLNDIDVSETFRQKAYFPHVSKILVDTMEGVEIQIIELKGFIDTLKD